MSYPGFNLKTLVTQVNTNTSNILLVSGQVSSLSGTIANNASGVRSIGTSGDGNFAGILGITGIGQATATISSSNAYGFSGLITISGKEPLFAVSGGVFQNRPIIFSGSGNTQIRLIDVGSGVMVNYAPTPDKKLFVRIGATSIFNHYSIANAASGNNFALSFQIPDDFNHVVKVELIGIPSAGAATPANTLTYATSYGAIGASASSNGETVATIYNLTSSGNSNVSFPVTGMFLNAARGHIIGFEFTCTQTSGNIRFPGFIFNYR